MDLPPFIVVSLFPLLTADEKGQLDAASFG
jgi:hypothetical protein